jgi:hypothetical protein
MTLESLFLPWRTNSPIPIDYILRFHETDLPLAEAGIFLKMLSEEGFASATPVLDAPRAAVFGSVP